MISHSNISGGRASARRIVASVAAIVLCLMPITRAAETGPQPSTTVTVQEEHGIYLVRARFHVMQSPAVALAVLTDYENIPRFMPGITTSVVLERGAGRAVVEQEGVSTFLMVSKRVHLVLEITEAADTLRFRDRCRRSFASYEGSWKVSAENGLTQLVYELRARPSFGVPEMVLKRLLRRDSARMIEALRQEMLRAADQQ